jgi:DNA-binding transcriptional MerR regulator
VEPALAALARRYRIEPGRQEAVGRAAARLGTTPRMLRYRERLGLIGPARTRAGYRAYGSDDLLAAALAAGLEAREGVAPAAVAFALRAVADPRLAAELRTLGGLARRDGADALDFETRKARRLLRLAG